MSQMLVGIDVSLRSHHVHFMHGEGYTLTDFSVPNDIKGADTLIQKIVRTAEKNQTDQLKIGMEATDQYSWHLAHYLKAQCKRYYHIFKQRFICSMHVKLLVLKGL